MIGVFGCVALIFEFESDSPMKQKSASTAKLPTKHKTVLTSHPSTKRLEGYAVDKPHSRGEERGKERHGQHQGGKNKSTSGIR